MLRMLWCTAGALFGVGAALWLAGPLASPFLLASLGGSAVFLFALAHAPAAQPRALFGGHLGGAFIGIVCYQAFGDALWVYVIAHALTQMYMQFTRTVHPPAGANPLIMVYAHAGPAALWFPVGLGILMLTLVAIVWSRLVPGMSRYPRAWLEESPSTLPWQVQDP